MILTFDPKPIQFIYTSVRLGGIVLYEDDEDFFIPDLTYLLSLYPYKVTNLEFAVEFAMARAVADPSLLGCESVLDLKRASSANITMVVDGVYTLLAPIREFKKIVQAIPPDTPIQLSASELERLLSHTSS